MKKSRFVAAFLCSMEKLLSIVIPAYNEEPRIGDTLSEIMAFLEADGRNYEIIVVDDGSNDATVEVITTFGAKVRVLKQPQNMGKGAAVRRGMLEARGDIRLFTDADLSTPIHELKKIDMCLSLGHDICIGSRAVDASLIKKHQPFYREFMGKTFNKIVQFLVLKGISDTQCGFKAFRAEAAECIFPETKINGFGFDVEVLYLARRAGLKIGEVSVEWYNDERTTVNPVTDSLKMLSEILQIKKIHG